MCSVIVKEGRDVATMDRPGFFLQTEQEKENAVLLESTRATATLLVECIQEKLKKGLQRENGKQVIYVVCDKAI